MLRLTEQDMVSVVNMRAYNRRMAIWIFSLLALLAIAIPLVVFAGTAGLVVGFLAYVVWFGLTVWQRIRWTREDKYQAFLMYLEYTAQMGQERPQ